MDRYLKHVQIVVEKLPCFYRCFINLLINNNLNTGHKSMS